LIRFIQIFATVGIRYGYTGAVAASWHKNFMIMAPDLHSFYATFAASIRSVGTAVTLAGVGVYLHRRKFVSSDGKRTLARISQQVTFPLFLFTKICYCNQDWSDEPCPDVTKSLSDVWILLFWPAVVVACGFLVGYVAALVSGTPKSQLRTVLVATGFGNSTGLAITLVTVVHANFPDTSDLGRIDPTLFLSVYLLLYPILQWGVGGWLLAPTENEAEPDSNGHQEVLESIRIEKGEGVMHHRVYNRNVLNNKQKQSFYKLSRKAIDETDASLYISDADLVHHLNAAESSAPDALPELPMAPTDSNRSHQSEGAYGTPLSPIVDYQQSALRSPRNDTPDANETTGLLSNATDQIGFPLGSDSRDSVKSTATEYEAETFRETFDKIMSRCFQPPVVGALAGIFVAATPLRGIFVDVVDRSSHAPLQWCFDGLYAVGQAAVPVNMIILGCNLSASYMAQAPSTNDAAEGEMRPASNLLSQRTMVAIVIGKMLVMPFIGIMFALLLETYVLDIPSGALACDPCLWHLFSRLIRFLLHCFVLLHYCQILMRPFTLFS
jgi:predicted permease